MTSEVTQAALEPCPFCGGNAKVDDEESDDVGGYFASCTKCPVSAWGDTREEAIAAWNTRLNARQSGEGEREATLEAALWSVLSYDQLLRQYEGPQAILFAGDVEKIDATYDAMIAKVTAALRATDEGSK